MGLGQEASVQGTGTAMATSCRHFTAHAGPEAGSPSHGVSVGEIGQCCQWLGTLNEQIVIDGSPEEPSRAASSFAVTLELGEFRVLWSRKV